MREKELAAARLAFEAGNLSGLVDALMVCEEHSLALPGWVHEALKEFLPPELTARISSSEALSLALHEEISPALWTYLREYRAKGRGRHSRWLTGWLQDLKDASLHAWVTSGREAREDREEDAREWGLLRPSALAVERLLTEEEYALADLARLMRVSRWPHPRGFVGEKGRIFAEVSRILERKGVHLSPAAVKAAYLRVKQRKQSQPHRYYWGRLARTIARERGLD